MCLVGSCQARANNKDLHVFIYQVNVITKGHYNKGPGSPQISEIPKNVTFQKMWDSGHLACVPCSATLAQKG